MSVEMKFSDELVEVAMRHATAAHRSVSQQIEYWARLGKALDENPEAPVQFIKDILLACEEANAGKLSPYRFGA